MRNFAVGIEARVAPRPNSQREGTETSEDTGVRSSYRVLVVLCALPPFGSRSRRRGLGRTSAYLVGELWRRGGDVKQATAWCSPCSFRVLRVDLFRSGALMHRSH